VETGQRSGHQRAEIFRSVLGSTSLGANRRPSRSRCSTAAAGVAGFRRYPPRASRPVRKGYQRTTRSGGDSLMTRKCRLGILRARPAGGCYRRNRATVQCFSS
jgi:hypothetical protein